MKKIIQTLLIILISFSNFSLATAASTTDKDIQKAYNACLEVAKTPTDCDYILTSDPIQNTLPDLTKPDNLPGPNISEDASGEDIQTYIRTRVLPKLASRLITIATIVSIFMLVYSGILFVVALGSEEKIKDATKTAIYAVVGLSFSLASYLIVSIVNSINLN